MPATRLIPATDDGAFPYDEVLAHLSTLDGVMYWDEAHRTACAPLLASMAKKLGVRIWHQESPYFVKRPT